MLRLIALVISLSLASSVQAQTGVPATRTLRGGVETEGDPVRQALGRNQSHDRRRGRGDGRPHHCGGNGQWRSSRGG